MLITSSETVAGKEIAEYSNVVFATECASLTLNRGIKVQGLLEKCRLKLSKMSWPDAIIGVRMSVSSGGPDMIVSLMGTPVKFKK